MTEQAKDNLNIFLDGLAELSRRHRIGITGQPELYEMETEDAERAYTVDDESRLLHGGSVAHKTEAALIREGWNLDGEY